MIVCRSVAFLFGNVHPHLKRQRFVSATVARLQDDAGAAPPYHLRYLQVLVRNLQGRNRPEDSIGGIGWRIRQEEIGQRIQSENSVEGIGRRNRSEESGEGIGRRNPSEESVGGVAFGQKILDADPIW